MNDKIESITNRIKKGERRNLSFGEYRWMAVKTENDRALLVTEDAIAERRYNETKKPVSWVSSSLRTELNTRFLSTFDSNERELIKSTEVTNDNPCFCTSDYIFILSKPEAEEYIYSERLLNVKFNGNASAWWLRQTSGWEHDYSPFVGQKGDLRNYYVMSVSAPLGVRPALWISLD